MKAIAFMFTFEGQAYGRGVEYERELALTDPGPIARKLRQSFEIVLSEALTTHEALPALDVRLVVSEANELVAAGPAKATVAVNPFTAMTRQWEGRRRRLRFTVAGAVDFDAHVRKALAA